MRFFLCLVIVYSIATPVLSQKRKLTIIIKNDTKTEQQAGAQLERLQKNYDLSPWLFTDSVNVNDKEFIPFSHPVLTVNSRYLENDDYQLSTLLHEQFHWTEEQQRAGFRGAIGEFKARFPDAPARGQSGAQDSYSTYLHLVICDLEFQVMTRLRGEQTARAVLGQWKHYSWIYEKVLNDPAIREINTKYKLTIDDLKRR